MRWAAFVGAKPANAARPRCAEVLPVTMIAPSPAATIAGAVSLARWNNAMVLIWKFRSSVTALSCTGNGGRYVTDTFHNRQDLHRLQLDRDVHLLQLRECQVAVRATKIIKKFDILCHDLVLSEGSRRRRTESSAPGPGRSMARSGGTAWPVSVSTSASISGRPVSRSMVSTVGAPKPVASQRSPHSRNAKFTFQRSRPIGVRR